MSARTSLVCVFLVSAVLFGGSSGLHAPPSFVRFRSFVLSLHSWFFPPVRWI
ncbi:hypothetical protein BKA93DRAFT_808751 [Sparassis latifolia]